MLPLKEKSNVISDNDVTEEIDVSDLTNSEGVPSYSLEYDTADTAKIESNDSASASRVDGAYVAGFNEGFTFGKINILRVAREILIRAGNTEDEANNITSIIATHAGVSVAYNHWLLQLKNLL